MSALIGNLIYPTSEQVMSLALERVDLDYALIAELKTLQTLVLRDCAFDCGYPDLGCLKVRQSQSVGLQMHM